MNIKENIDIIRNNIYLSCKKAGRSPDNIILMAVTKTIDTSRMLEAYNAGIKIFGENKVQEIREKYPVIGDKVSWHMIGTLQTNKVKYIIDKVDLIHSVDNIKLAEEINKRAAAINKIQNILVEVNIGMENTKGGISPDATLEFIKDISNLKNIHIQGLMAIAPFTDDKEKTRPYFRKMFELFNLIKLKKIPNTEAKFLSMGMTNDYMIALEEGANIIRIGTGIFGKRNYEK